MAFGTSHFAAANATKTSTIGAGVPSIYYSKKFLDLLTKKLVLPMYGQQVPLPEGNGKTIELTRWRTLGPALTALSEGVNPDAEKIYTQKISATLKEYGNYTQISSLLQQAFIHPELDEAAEVIADQAAQTINRLLLYEICSNGIYPLCADLSATSTYSGALTTVTSTTDVDGGALLEANTNYGDADDDLNQSIITFTSGSCQGQSRVITDYDADGGATGTDAAGAMTLSPALDMTPEVGDTFIVTTPDEITTGDDLSFTNVKKARTILKKNHARTFGNGYYISVVGPDQYNELMDDTVWQGVHSYQDNMRGILDSEVGKLGNVRFIEADDPFCFPITTRGTSGTSYGPGAQGANYSATGGVACVPVFGKNAFGNSTFAKKSGQIPRLPVKIKKANKYDKSDPLDRSMTMGWAIEYAPKALYAPHCVGIWVHNNY